MAKANSTRGTRSTRALKDEPQFVQMALDLNKFGALLKGVGEICKAGEIGGDALYVAAHTRYNDSATSRDSFFPTPTGSFFPSLVCVTVFYELHLPHVRR